MNHLTRSLRFAAVTALVALLASIAGLSISPHASAQAGNCDAAGAQSIVDLAAASSDFELLTQSVATANLTGVLDNNASFTVFVPTDAAFVALAQDLGYEGSDEAGAFNAIVAALTELGNGDPLPILDAVLKYHLLGTQLTLSELQAAGTVTTIQGGTLTVNGSTLIDNAPALDDATMLSNNITACNGTLHFINRVLLPIAVEAAVDPAPAPTPTPAPVVEAERLASPGNIGNAPPVDVDGAFGFGIVAAAGAEQAAVPAAAGETGGTGGGDAGAGLAVTGSSSEAAMAIAVGLFAVGGSFVVSGRRRLR